jgi:uncharacterized protein (TIGR02145 family)
MKKIITLFIALFITTITFGQVPEKMSYQGVIRNSGNILVINQTVGMQISILQGGDLANPGPTISYVETQTPTTNANGLVSLEIGAGTAGTGSFASINWANGPYFIKTETDPSGGTSYSITGTTELMSVPYALYAANGISSVQADEIAANTLKAGQSLGATAGDMQYWSGTAWVIVPSSINEGASLQSIGGIPTWVGGTPPATAPGAVIIGTATAADAQATVSFTAPSNDGGSAITSYTATSSPDNITGTLTQAGSGSILVTGLTNGTIYTFTVTATNAVGESTASVASNPVTPKAATAPDAPTGVIAIAGNTQATVAFTAPSNDGGSAITSYTATSSPDNITGTLTQAGSGSILVTGLTNGTIYTFTVTATNAVGESAASATSNEVTPATTPDAPTGVTAIAGNTQATVAFTAPSNDGGSAITSYTATSLPDNITGTLTQAGSGSILVTGLTNGTIYTFTVTATNAVGESTASATSNSVTALSSVTIGTQVWQNRNLDVPTYRDGTIIPEVTNQTAWAGLKTGAWCYYNNDPANSKNYGKLYNHYAVMGITVAEDATPTATQIAARKQLAPIGWHVPTDSEWSTLTTFLDLQDPMGNIGGKMKETGTTFWASPNAGATNSSGFTGLPGGYRYSDGMFNFVSYTGFWWSFTITPYPYFLLLNYNDGNGPSYQSSRTYGFSVRCLRD